MDNTENQQENENTGLQVDVTSASPAMVINAAAPELINILKDNITKIQEDPKYIPQAVAIADQIGKIIDVSKTQIDGFRVIASLANKK